MRIFYVSELGAQGIVKLLRRAAEHVEDHIALTVGEIVADVMAGGDEALCRHTLLHDGCELDPSTIEATAGELASAAAEVSPADTEILAIAARRIEKYHQKQLLALRNEDWHYHEGEGIRLGQLIRPLKRVGLYAPGGRAAYPSSVLMAAIPARVAGVSEVFLVSPLRGGRLNPLVALAARISGINRVFKIGGAQAVAALAYGTETIPPVDKIVGPGNAYVTAAKKRVYGQVAIDMIAGPSEILIIADRNSDPALVAADLLGQAEHDEMACAILVTPDASLAARVKEEIDIQISGLPRHDIARRALEDHGAIVISQNIDEAFELANLYGPEHLEIMLPQPEAWLKKVENAGCVFLGESTPETIGDYMAGSNHILPTGGTARFSSPLGVYDFIKRTSVVCFSPEDLAAFGTAAARFARLEGLDGHARSINLRVERNAASGLSAKPSNKS